MQTGNLLLLLVVMVAGAYYLGHRRSYALARPLGGIRHLHSLPFYFAMRSAMWCAIPAMVVLALWLAFDDSIIRQQVLASLPQQLQPTDASSYNLTLSKIQNVASGALPTSFVEPPIAEAAQRLQSLKQTSAMALTVVVIVLCMLGGAWAWLKVSPQLRARQQVLCCRYCSNRFASSAGCRSRISCSGCSGVRRPPCARTRWPPAVPSVRCPCSWGPC